MLGDLDLLLTAVLATVDDLLPDRAKSLFQKVWRDRGWLSCEDVGVSRRDRLRIEFEPPRSGWTRVSLRHGRATYEFWPSYTPYDSIGELIVGLLALVQGREEIVVRWNDEPVEHVMSFVRARDSARMTLAVVEPRVGGEVLCAVFGFTGTLRDTVRPFWKALRDMQGQQSVASYEQEWRHRFPDGAMARLSAEVRALALRVEQETLADDGAAEVHEGFVKFGSSFPAKSEAPKEVQPGEGALDDPAAVPET